MIDDIAQERARALITRLRRLKVKVGTAESLTGGLIAATLTSIPKASDVVVMGAVVYTWEAKQRMLGVPLAMLENHTAESAPVVGAMARGVISREPMVDLSVAVSGVAGPGPYGETPAGRVFIAVAYRTPEGLHAETVQQDYGDIGREAVRLATLKDAMALMDTALNRWGA